MRNPSLFLPTFISYLSCFDGNETLLDYIDVDHTLITSNKSVSNKLVNIVKTTNCMSQRCYGRIEREREMS